MEPLAWHGLLVLTWHRLSCFGPACSNHAPLAAPHTHRRPWPCACLSTAGSAASAWHPAPATSHCPIAPPSPGSGASAAPLPSPPPPSTACCGTMALRPPCPPPTGRSWCWRQRWSWAFQRGCRTESSRQGRGHAAGALAASGGTRCAGVPCACMHCGRLCQCNQPTHGTAWQVYGGLVQMDFSPAALESTAGRGRHMSLDPALLPPLHLIYRCGGGRQVL